MALPNTRSFSSYMTLPSMSVRVPPIKSLMLALAQAVLFALVSGFVLHVLEQIDRAPQHTLADPLAFMFLFGAMVVLRLIAVRLGSDGLPALLVPALFPAALPFTFMQRTVLTDFGEWFVLLLLAYLLLRGWRTTFAALVCVACLITPLALCMPIIFLPVLVARWGRRRGLNFALLVVAGGWVSTLVTSSLSWGHGSQLFYSGEIFWVWTRLVQLVTEHSAEDFARLWRLIPQGANLVNMLVLMLLVERFVLGASRPYLRSLWLAFLTCMVLSLMGRQSTGHLLALVIAPLFICLIDGLRRVPSHFKNPPVPISPQGISSLPRLS